jgi:hypothetical protein
MPHWTVALGALLLAAAAPVVYADYDRGMAALQKRDLAAAFKELRAAAEDGDERAFAPLAKLYGQGAGTPRDLDAALGWAKKSAAKGNADGQFLVYALIASSPALNFVDAQGRVDAQRYRELAARPISGREDEMTAYDNLGKAAERGHLDALLSLAGFFGDNVGEGNRARAIAILDKTPQRPPVLDDLRKRLTELDAIGPTLAIPRIADEVRDVAAKTAQAAAAEKDPAKDACKDVKVLKAQRMGPVVRPIWLPLAVPDLKTAYLMSGEWRERWYFDVCGAESIAIVQFKADGMGAATVTAERAR